MEIKSTDFKDIFLFWSFTIKSLRWKWVGHMENVFGHLSLSLSLKFQPPPPMIMIMMLMQIDLFYYGRHDNINSFIFLQISIFGLMLWSKNFVVFKHVTSNRRLERRDHIWFYMIYERICEAHNLELRFVWHAVFVKKNFFPGLSSQRHSKAYRFLLLKLWLPPVAVFHLLILIQYQILPQKVKYIQR